MAASALAAEKEVHFLRPRLGRCAGSCVSCASGSPASPRARPAPTAAAVHARSADQRCRHRRPLRRFAQERASVAAIRQHNGRRRSPLGPLSGSACFGSGCRLTDCASMGSTAFGSAAWPRRLSARPASTPRRYRSPCRTPPSAGAHAKRRLDRLGLDHRLRLDRPAIPGFRLDPAVVGRKGVALRARLGGRHRLRLSRAVVDRRALDARLGPRGGGRSRDLAGAAFEPHGLAVDDRRRAGGDPRSAMSIRFSLTRNRMSIVSQAMRAATMPAMQRTMVEMADQYQPGNRRRCPIDPLDARGEAPGR